MFSQYHNHTVRDTNLNGICAGGTIDFNGVVNTSRTVVDPTCNFVAYGLSDCDNAEETTIMSSFIRARRSETQTDGIQCEISNKICATYSRNQDICLTSTFQRNILNKVLGGLCLVLLPLIFHPDYRRFAPLFSYTTIAICSIANLSYQYFPDTCLFYSNYFLSISSLIVALVFLTVWAVTQAQEMRGHRKEATVTEATRTRGAAGREGQAAAARRQSTFADVAVSFDEPAM